jgi:hypothetical protein
MKNLFLALIVFSVSAHAAFVTLKAGSLVVADAATPECLSADTSLASQSILVIAKAANISNVVVGGPDLIDAGPGIPIAAGNAASISGKLVGKTDAAVKLSQICVDVGTNGDGVDFVYFE